MLKLIFHSSVLFIATSSMFILPFVFVAVCVKSCVNYEMRTHSKIDLVEQIESPSKKYTVTMVEFHGGGLDSDSETIINLRKKEEAFVPIKWRGLFWALTADFNLENNIVDIGGFGFPIKIHWVSDQVLKVEIPSYCLDYENAEIMKKTWGDVQIVYEIKKMKQPTPKFKFRKPMPIGNGKGLNF